MMVGGGVIMADHLELVIVTGMSGAGKTVAIQSFEDMGYYCVDNMPPTLLPKFWDLLKESGKITRIALGMDLRTREFFDELEEVTRELDNNSFVTTHILFLEASDEALISRYKETRRNHPLMNSGRLVDGIHKEREWLQPLKSRAQHIIDTTNITPRQLRHQILHQFGREGTSTFRVELMSFGFKYAPALDADIVMDVRFLPNPHYIDELRPLTGLDAPVYDYVMQQPETQVFYKKFIDLIDYVLPGYKKEGKPTVTIAIGCTGGQHRSISLVERIAKHLENENYIVNVTHRDRYKKIERMEKS